jgi:hypothetical protein
MFVCCKVYHQLYSHKSHLYVIKYSEIGNVHKLICILILSYGLFSAAVAADYMMSNYKMTND